MFVLKIKKSCKSVVYLANCQMYFTGVNEGFEYIFDKRSGGKKEGLDSTLSIKSDIEHIFTSFLDYQ